MSKPQKRPTMLAPECRLGKDALRWWRSAARSEPTYMRLTGDGCVAFGWRENLPDNTQSEHFVDADGSKYDAGESSASIYTILGIPAQ